MADLHHAQKKPKCAPCATNSDGLVSLALHPRVKLPCTLYMLAVSQKLSPPEQLSQAQRPGPSLPVCSLHAVKTCQQDFL